MERNCILGISAFYHDSAACLVRDGEIVAAAQEERFSRKKQDERFPHRAIAYCLKAGGVTPAQLLRVAFYDKPWLKFERLLDTYLAFAPAGISSFLQSMPIWLNDKLWISGLIQKELPYDGEIVFPEHHQSHAASAFFPSPFERAAILTVDGVGEWATASCGVGRANRMELRHELHFPHSLGLLYGAFTYYTGFKVNSDEYKVMGLAPYGEPKFVDLILSELMDLRADGSFQLNMDYFNYCQGLTMTSERFHELLGAPPRRPDAELTQRDMDLARSIQEVTDEVMVRMARYVKNETGESNLCLAGGVALNCVSNGKILREGIFDQIWIQPAAGDAGGALGAALFAWHQVLDQPRPVDPPRDRMAGAYLGPQFGGEEIEAWLKKAGLAYHRPDPGEMPKLVARLIADGKVVGWFSGRMEFGPRALGARSILADARNPRMQSVLNLRIKNRESFRPFAPTCLREDVAEFFEINCDSPYMLLVAPIKATRRLPATAAQERLFGIAKLNVARSDLPAITHVDYSARIQTLAADTQAAYRRLLEEIKTLTGLGIVLNTSFNVRDEPIVCTPQEAYRCFMNTGMDVLVMENSVLYKAEQPAARPPDEPSPGREDRSDRPVGLRRFGLSMALSLSVIGGLLLWRGHSWGIVFAVLAASFLLSGLFASRLLAPVEKIFATLARIISLIITRVALTLVFYLCVTPLGWLLRMLGKDLLKLKRGSAGKSYWVPVEADGPGSRPDKPY